MASTEVAGTAASSGRSAPASAGSGGSLGAVSGAAGVRSGQNAGSGGVRARDTNAGRSASSAGDRAGVGGSAAAGDHAGVGGSAAAGAGASPGAAGDGAGTAGQGSTAGYAPCPADDVCKILPLGDSITFGIGYNGGYRVELFRKALADGKQITFTGSLSNGPDMVDSARFPKNNEGHSGWKIDQLLPLIPMPALEQPPHIVLLMIGTNDIAQNDQLSEAPERLAGLIDKLVMHAPDALIVVAKLTPLNRSMAVETYNDAIPAVVDERAAAGKHIVLVDQFDGFPTSELGDGVHPNQQGYERMASIWYQAIADLLH